jgi:hypothetical protein
MWASKPVLTGTIPTLATGRGVAETRSIPRLGGAETEIAPMVIGVVAGKRMIEAERAVKPLAWTSARKSGRASISVSG